ncbi:outer dense fiber protein 2-like isoform X1 [Girardinichthys multiradiatus]|uniref:outer dense fiber protein 2-like isoform X1 n=1 Tax=Girardinichthys multiradiatus TaxID=208333 RepID=UPI001FAB7B3C|nr:outer dense fiber protein 2-like isoform X1 [Girardinichthys multiradiatus]XP_047224912.1 outer dense fiber protein 2-like isoform X1 [Girardinichthys multiradiatus]XP_047224913.1 outer dense fiber protein 2-like isoform X1 [Girardinichthys multiradiatus]XP_047224915.1 outer dense fiber protein 2-like isoform X1 [Girardinichthys multiradiatus]
MSPEGNPQSPPLGFSTTKEDLPLSRGDLDNSHEPGGENRAHSSLQTRAESGHENFNNGRSHSLKVLIDAEVAASAAAIQLVAFKDAMEDEFAGSGRSTKDKRQTTRQKGLLLEKLEEFKRLNKSVRQKLKQLQDEEIYRIDADRKMDTLLKRIRKAESENEHLKRDLNETELRIGKLIDMRREEQENIKSMVHTSKSAEATRARLQGQLRNKEAENNRLTVQLRTLERTLTEQKLEINQLKASFASLTKKAAQDKESLKKATRAQKLRTERFEAAIEKCYAQLKEKDAELAKAHSERDSRRRQKEQMTDDREKLVAYIDLLKSQFADLTLRFQKEKDELNAANETMTQRLEKLIAENGDLTISNAALKASAARLEEQLADCESALVEEKTVSLERKHETKQYQYQVAELKAEIESLRIKYANLLLETERTREGKEMEVEKVRQELQGNVEELRVYPQLLSEAQQSLLECQENLQSLERKCSEKSESVKQLQFKAESQAKQLQSSVETKESVYEANLKVQEKVHSLQRKMEQLQQENLELVQKLTAQEEALSYGNRQLDQRSSECQTLNRQLEAALSDVREQVNKVKSHASSREEALQTKILELHAEKSRRDNELRLLRQSKQTAEKQFEVRLKDLQLSLDQSESHKRSIQNYVDFLKNSYKTMFDEGLQTSAFGPSYFLK